jgi:hypothetical protein
MRQEVFRKVINDLVVTPWTGGTFLVGITVLLGSWMFGWTSGILMGVGGILTGLGIFGTKFGFSIDQITKDAYASVIQKGEDERTKILDDLDKVLREDRDPRPEVCLRQLRNLYEEIKEQAKDNPLGMQVLDNFRQMFDACVAKIKETDSLWRKAKGLEGSLKKRIVTERDELVSEIEVTTQKLTDSIGKYKTSAKRTPLQDARLEELQQELDMTLEVARRTGERMSGLGKEQKIYDPKEFE